MALALSAAWSAREAPGMATTVSPAKWINHN